MTFTIEPVVPSKEQSGVDFGVIINDLDLETISGEYLIKRIRVNLLTSTHAKK